MTSKAPRVKKIQNISIIQLKEYLKPVLVEIANAVNSMMLPLNPAFEKKEYIGK